MQVHYILSVVLVSSLVTLSFQFDSLSSSQVEDIEKKLRSVIGRGSLATAVRLNFHDCVGKVLEDYKYTISIVQEVAMVA